MLEEVGQRPERKLFGRFFMPDGYGTAGVGRSNLMTIHATIPQGELSRNEAAEALELFDLASTILRRILEEAREGALEVPVKELASYTKDVSSALKTLVTERQHVEKLRRDAGELVSGGVFDLGKARDEIGRRLARLRDAGGD